MTSPLEQKKLKVTGPVVITANRLGDGVVVYRTGAGWTTRLDRAAVATTAEVAGRLFASAVADDVGAVGAYVAPVRLERDGAIKPGNLREQIRQAGPTFELPLVFGI
jgi:predicted NAD/FAD-binding protein